MSETNPPAANDLVTRLLAMLDHALDQLHDRVLRPIIIAGRTVAFGFILMLVGALAIIFTLLVLFRLVDLYAFPGLQWITYLMFGSVFVLGGLFLWRKRRPVRLRK